MARARFDHLAAEVSVAVGVAIPRYPLWLRLRELGADPESLSQEDAVAFCSGPLTRFLVEQGHWLPLRRRRRLQKAVERFDPAQPTPAERLSFGSSDAR